MQTAAVARWRSIPRRFSLRMLLVLTMLCAVGLGVVFSHYRHKAHVFARLRELGCFVGGKHLGPAHYLYSYELYYDPQLRRLLGQDYAGVPTYLIQFTTVKTTVAREKQERADEPHEELESVPAVQKSDPAICEHGKLTDDDAALLAYFTSWESLVLGETELTDAGLLRLVPITSLKQLVISGSRLTPGGIEEFRQARPDVCFSHAPL